MTREKHRPPNASHKGAGGDGRGHRCSSSTGDGVGGDVREGDGVVLGDVRTSGSIGVDGSDHSGGGTEAKSLGEGDSNGGGAESCVGGWASKVIGDADGSSVDGSGCAGAGAGGANTCGGGGGGERDRSRAALLSAPRRSFFCWYASAAALTSASIAALASVSVGLQSIAGLVSAF